MRLRVTNWWTINGKPFKPGDIIEEKDEQKARYLETAGVAVKIKEEQPPSHGNQRFTLKDYRYFDTLKRDKRYLIQGFLYPATLNAIWSPPEHFKSMLSSYLALQLTTGKSFLGLKTKKQPVLILDNENNDQIIKTRLENIRRGEKTRSKKFPLYYITDGGALFDSPLGFQELLKTIKEKKIKLLIIDTLHRFADYEENKADDINKIYRETFKPILELDCAVLYLHHTGKDNKYRGSIDLLGMVDSAFKIDRANRNTPKFSIICEKSRFGDNSKLMGEFEFGEEYTRITRLNEEEEDREEKGRFMEVVNHLVHLFTIKGDAWKTGDILSEFEALRDTNRLHASPRTVKGALNWLKRKGKIKQEKRGEYTRCWVGEFKLGDS